MAQSIPVEDVPLERACQACGEVFAKPPTESRKDWTEGHRYCSRRCAKVGKPPWNKGLRRPSVAKRIPCRICGDPTPYCGTERSKLWGIVHCGKTDCAIASDQIKRERIARALSGRDVGGGWHNTAIVSRQELVLAPWFAERGWIAQYPIRPGMPWKFWRLDFAEPSLRLAVEIDGSAHRKLDRRHRDADRDHRLRQLGWHVLHVPAELVDTDCETVKLYVLAWVRSTGRR